MKINEYLSAAIFFEDTPDATDKQKAELVKEHLISEGCFCKYNLARYKTYQNCISQHIQGLPSYINIPFNYCEILELAKKLGTLPENATEKQEDKILANYWNYMAFKIIQWCNKNEVSLLNQI